VGKRLECPDKIAMEQFLGVLVAALIIIMYHPNPKKFFFASNYQRLGP
jgi:hypothetical protein